MNGYTPSLIIPHKDWIDAFVSLVESYNSMFQTELSAHPVYYQTLKEDNILTEEYNGDRITFQIVEKTEKSS
jgi:hypothetical protein